MKEPKFKLNDKVSHNGHVFYVHGVRVATQCHPEIEFEYSLGDLEARPSTTNEAKYHAREREIMTVEDSCEADLKEIAHFYGGWDKLKKVIQNLEDNDNEAAYERMQNRN